MTLPEQLAQDPVFRADCKIETLSWLKEQYRGGYSPGTVQRARDLVLKTKPQENPVKDDTVAVPAPLVTEPDGQLAIAPTPTSYTIGVDIGSPEGDFTIKTTLDGTPVGEAIEKLSDLALSPEDAALLLHEQMMDSTEAKHVDDKIIQSSTELGTYLLAMQEREGWKALKMPSWEAYFLHVCKRTDFSRATLYRKIQASRVTRNLSLINETERKRLPKVNPAQALVLAKLSNEEQPKALERAKELDVTEPPVGKAAQFHHPGKVTTKHVEQAVEEILATRAPEPVQTTIEDEFIFPEPAKPAETKKSAFPRHQAPVFDLNEKPDICAFVRFEATEETGIYLLHGRDGSGRLVAIPFREQQWKERPR